MFEPGDIRPFIEKHPGYMPMGMTTEGINTWQKGLTMSVPFKGVDI